MGLDRTEWSIKKKILVRVLGRPVEIDGRKYTTLFDVKEHQG